MSIDVTSIAKLRVPQRQQANANGELAAYLLELRYLADTLEAFRLQVLAIQYQLEGRVRAN